MIKVAFDFKMLTSLMTRFGGLARMFTPSKAPSWRSAACSSQLGAMVLTGFGAVPIAVGLAIAAIAGIGIAIYKYWDEIKAFFSQSWGDIGTQLKDKIVGAFTGALAAAKDLWTEFWTWATEGSMQDRAFEANKEGGAFAKMKAGYAKLKEAEDAKQPAIPDDPRIQGLRGLSDEHKQALAGLDDITAKTKEVEKIERAIAALQGASDDVQRSSQRAGNPPPGGAARTAEAAARSGQGTAAHDGHRDRRRAGDHCRAEEPARGAGRNPRAGGSGRQADRRPAQGHRAEDQGAPGRQEGDRLCAS